jgi:hypothetical protein
MSANLWAAIEASPIAETVRSSAWLYPTVLTLHLLAMAALVAGGVLLDLRLLGLTRLPLRPLLSATEPVLVGAALTAISTGGLRFTAEASALVDNPAFQAKIILLAVAMGNALGFTMGARRAVDTWARDLRPPIAARLAGGVGLIGWLSVAVAGRLIAFI